MSDAKVTVTADLSDFKHEFALANQFAEARLKETRDATRRHMASAAGHVGASTDAMSGAVERAASLMGGAFGDVADIVLDLGGRMGGLVGPVGAVAAGVAGLAYASLQAASYADEAAGRLEDLGLAAQLPADARQSVDDYREATASLRIETDQLAVQMAGPLLDALTNVSNMLTGMIGTAGRVGDAFSGLGTVVDRVKSVAENEMVADVGGGIANGVLTGLTGGLAKPLLDYIVKPAIEQVVELGDTQAEVNANNVAIAEMGKKYADQAAQAFADANGVAADAKRAADAARAAEKEHAEALRESAKAAAEKKKELEELAKAQLEAELYLRRELQRRQQDDAALTDRLAAGEATFAANTATVGATSAGLSDLSGLVDGLGPQIGIAAAKGMLPILTGGGAGALGAIGAAGPVGAALVAVTQIPSVIEGIDNTLDELTDTFRNLPDALRTALGETLPDILRDLPDLVGAVLDLLVDLPLILAEVLPEILTELIAAIPSILARAIETLPAMLATVFYELPKAFAMAIADALNPFSSGPDGDRNILGTNLTARGGRRVFGWDLPEFSRGTSEITRTGLAVVHRGEEIRRAGEGRSGGGGRLASAPVIHVYGSDPREVVRQLREILGGDYGASYGLGERLP